MFAMPTTSPSASAPPRISQHVRDAYNLAIGERTAEDIKIKVGSAVPLKDELDVEVNGRDVITGLPKTVRIESEEIRRALNKPLDEMTKAVKDALDATPPDLASDLMYYDIKIKVGSAVPLKDELDVEVNGRDVITGLPKTVRIESEEIRRALNKPLDEMTKAVKDALDATPPDLASDLMYYRILLTGGGAMLRGLDVRLRDETGVAVNVSPTALDKTGVAVNVSPTALDNVVNGCARVLEANAFDGGFVQSNA